VGFPLQHTGKLHQQRLDRETLWLASSLCAFRFPGPYKDHLLPFDRPGCYYRHPEFYPLSHPPSAQRLL
jgi:hypothetical protein